MILIDKVRNQTEKNNQEKTTNLNFKKQNKNCQVELKN